MDDYMLRMIIVPLFTQPDYSHATITTFASGLARRCKLLENLLPFYRYVATVETSDTYLKQLHNIHSGITVFQRDLDDATERRPGPSTK